MEQMKGRLFLLGAFTLAGTSVIVARFVSGHLGTFTITSVSLFFAVLFLLPICKNKLVVNIKSMSMKDWHLTLLQAIFGIFLFRMFLLLGISRTSSAEAGILTGATPAITALIARTLMKERISKKGFVGIGCTISGIFIVQGILAPGSNFEFAHFIGNLLILCAAASESIFNTLSRVNSMKKVERAHTLDPLFQTTLVSTIAMLLCLLPASFEHPVEALVALNPGEWIALMWYGIFVTALAFIFWYSGIKRSSMYTASAFSGMMPLTSLILSVLILKEKTVLEQWSGALLVIIGMVLVGQSQAGNKRNTQQ